uniref:Uncharacterized protein n=1 Tax=Pseudonaja textilis TaxID=8673 RepID=A0A670ZD95_PSETE
VTGQLHVLLPLDYEERKVYYLDVILKDLENEAAPNTQKTTTCNVTIFVTVTYWAPDPWFVVVLTLTGILFFSALGLLGPLEPGEAVFALLEAQEKTPEPGESENGPSAVV